MQVSTKKMLSVFFGAVCMLLCLTGCKKQDEFLDAKSQEGDIVLTTLSDFQAVLDYTPTMNTNYITLGQTGADNFYFPDVNYTSLQPYERNSVLWLKEIFPAGTNDIAYTSPYLVIRNSNIVLEGLEKITRTADNMARYDSVEGHARFARAFMFFELVNTFGKQYNEATAASDPGIPLRTFSDINILAGRAPVKNVYDFVINELKLVADRMPLNIQYMRPTKLSAYALLARVYLQKGDYVNAGRCCDSVLQYKTQLLNFNDSSLVSLSNTYRFPTYKSHPEILFYAEGLLTLVGAPSTSYAYCFADTVLYKSYAADDLRKTYFYNLLGANQAKFQGSYTGNSRIFAGLALNEVYFIRAECRARLHNIAGCLSDVNTLLKNRYRTGTYVGYETTDEEAALRFVLDERRKELPNTGQLRWEDLKRLNTEPKFAKVLTRIYNGVTYTLQPQSPRYVFPFAPKIIEQEGLQQNER